MIKFRVVVLAVLFLSSWARLVRAQSQEPYIPRPAMPRASLPVCGETPREDADPRLCVPDSGAEQEPGLSSASPVRIGLQIPSDTPLRIALDQRTRVRHRGELVHGTVVEAVYAFDQSVIPAGSSVSGHVTNVIPVSGGKRTLAYSNGNFSPFHKYDLTFDSLTLPDGRQIPIKTTVTPGTAEVVHLVSDPAKEKKQKNVAARTAENVKQEAEAQVQDTLAQIKKPGRLHRLKQLLLAQLPYRRQYIESGTRFNATLVDPLDFGEAERTHEQLAALGGAPMQNSLLHARLVLPVSSATAVRGTPVLALLTEPMFSPDHRVILPSDTRLIGQVVQVKPARRLHHNGELRFIFEHIETPQGGLQGMQGSLEGLQVDRAASMKLDEEGGTRVTDSKTRYLSTGLTVLLAAAASHPDAERGTTDAAGDPGVRAAAGGSGFRLTGALISFAAKSTPVSIAFSAYGASSSIYSNFLSRGRDVVLPKDTPLEIGFGNPRPAGSQPRPN
jgi:hypothetical protein